MCVCVRPCVNDSSITNDTHTVCIISSAKYYSSPGECMGLKKRKEQVHHEKADMMDLHVHSVYLCAFRGITNLW